MTYFQVYIPGAQDLFTWEGDNSLERGDFVELFFRSRLVRGLIVKKIFTKPEFKTQKIERLIQKRFTPEVSLDLADFLAESCFCSPIKVLNLMIPEGFFLEKDP